MINEVAVGDPVTAERTNQIIRHVNGTPGRAIYKESGIWTIPAGCHKFRVYLAGGGTSGYAYDIESGVRGADGARSPMCSKIFTGYEVGTSFVIEIGAAGKNVGATEVRNGGTSKFGTVLQSTGGIVANTVMGTHNGEILHANEIFCDIQTIWLGPSGNIDGGTHFVGYGAPGKGGQRMYRGSVDSPEAGWPGGPGICVIEW